MSRPLPPPVPTAAPPVPETWSDVFGRLVVTFVGLPLVFLGWMGLIFAVWFSVDHWRDYDTPRARDERALASLPVTPLRTLLPAPGTTAGPSFHDGALVRVEGFLCADPPVAALASREDFYAFQSLTVTHKYSRYEGETQWPPDTITDDEQNYCVPMSLEADPVGTDPSGRVELRVLAPSVWEFFLSRTFITVGKVDLPVTIPENVARRLALASVPPQRDQEWVLWAVPQHARVTVLAVARVREGRAVLELDADRFCVVSSKAWKDIAIPPLSAWQILGLVGGCAFCALLPVPWYFWKRLG